MQLWKFTTSLAYILFSHLLTCFVVVNVNDRMPDRKLYPPLPDVLLDNLTYIPWGASVAEICLVTLGIMWLFLCFFHKHRFIVMTRMFALMGTMYLLRCVTIFVTSIPCPNVNKECDIYPNATVWNRMYRALLIFSRMGIAIMGNRTCGDYVFSGHTIMMTMCNLFINEYTPRTMKVLHMISWSLNVLGMYFILASRGHYSIDVIIAFVISLQLFNNYHTIADNRITSVRERRCWFLCFPLLHFFESDIEGPIQYEYSTPLSFREKKIPDFTA
ncbi:hypothetical protein FSP39_013111 [Pinctada imbricata]|uniref:Sphingomyelin synthase-like domain-containing protein n=1 Tax=Pinctada imbricata TaxID=66713 RepID=A0AA88Y8A0_PINIB|nr:hypothetical protein FSP39_013111 [Pinctada imbricata]